jgi:hypothetical protein
VRGGEGHQCHRSAHLPLVGSISYPGHWLPILSTPPILGRTPSPAARPGAAQCGLGQRAGAFAVAPSCVDREEGLRTEHNVSNVDRFMRPARARDGGSGGTAPRGSRPTPWRTWSACTPRARSLSGPAPLPPSPRGWGFGAPYRAASPARWNVLSNNKKHEKPGSHSMRRSRVCVC